MPTDHKAGTHCAMLHSILSTFPNRANLPTSASTLDAQGNNVPFSQVQSDSAGCSMLDTLGYDTTCSCWSHNQFFTLTDQYTGKPLADVPYEIVTAEGEKLEGRTDAQGRTRKISDDAASSATIYVYEEYTPLNPDWDRTA
ncbi:hypothetical protein [Paraburkholderia sp. J67]|uniref:hypothetical protein n=1 Tax=Paraburkholderia sp. J67 TaxID=2805435 RepID=UPI002ABE0F6D|nr:hypothetical protein [Paraburkholderia sp. J67]